MMIRSLCLVACLGAACSRGETNPHVDDPPEDEVWLGSDQMVKANIQVADIAEHDLPQSIAAVGRIAFDDLRVSHVFSPVTGRVTRVLAKPGEHVPKGAPLIAIRSPDVGSAFADLVKAQADMQTSELDFQREQRLLAEQATSTRSKEAAEDVYRKAKAEYERSKQRAAMLRAGSLDIVTQEYVLRSFLEGEVIARMVNPGVEVVGQYSGGNAQELFTIGDIKSVWVNADVPDVDLPKVKLGDAIEIRVVAYPDRVFHGTIDYIGGTVDPTLRTGRIRASLSNEHEELKPEMLANVSIVQPPLRRLAVPREAVIAINESKFVYVASGTRPDGRLMFKRRAVTIGDARDDLVPILAGVSRGERVVVTGSVTREQPSDEVWPTPHQLEQGHISTAVVITHDIADAVTIGGRLTFDDTKISHVFSPVNGRITKVLARPGQRVTRGTPLVAILSPDVGSYMADLVKAEADKTQAEHEYQRQKELYDAQVGAKRDLEAADDALHKARAEYDRARQLTELLKSSDFDAVSQEYVLRSPIDGEVIARKAAPGLEVQGQYSNGGSSSNVVELYTIGELAELWVVGEVYEIDLPRVSEGDDVTIVMGEAGHTFHGKVDWVADVLDPVLHTAKVRCVIDNRDRLLKPEMYESVVVSVPGKQLLAVARDAVMRVDGQTIVFVRTGEIKANGGIVFRRRKVVVKLDDNAAVVPVLSGLTGGETVAVAHSVMLLGMLENSAAPGP